MQLAVTGSITNEQLAQLINGRKQLQEALTRQGLDYQADMTHWVIMEVLSQFVHDNKSS
jgi:hypothetical protein